MMLIRVFSKLTLVFSLSLCPPWLYTAADSACSGTTLEPYFLVWPRTWGSRDHVRLVHHCIFWWVSQNPSSSLPDPVAPVLPVRVSKPACGWSGVRFAVVGFPSYHGFGDRGGELLTTFVCYHAPFPPLNLFLALCIVHIHPYYTVTSPILAI